jgi:protoheme IX farnesyltransferase
MWRGAARSPGPRVHPRGSHSPAPGRAAGGAALTGIGGAGALPNSRSLTLMATYAELSKLGVVSLVLVSTAAGFLLAAPLGPEFPWREGLIAIAGVLLLSSGASALNQVQERRQDALMARTAGRPLPSGRLSIFHALCFAAVGIASGTILLWLGLGLAAGALGTMAAAFYNGVYTPWLKPSSPFAAVPGAVPGALPPVIGWVAAGGGPGDSSAVILFGVLFLWQMPHFWALALRYRNDYAAGGFPMVSEAVGVEGTARLILLYALALTALSLAAPTFGLGGPVSFAAAAVLGYRLVRLAARFAETPHDPRGWLSLFLFSNLYLLLLFAVMVFERLARYLLTV